MVFVDNLFKEKKETPKEEPVVEKQDVLKEEPKQNIQEKQPESKIKINHESAVDFSEIEKAKKTLIVSYGDVNVFKLSKCGYS